MSTRIIYFKFLSIAIGVKITCRSMRK